METKIIDHLKAGKPKRKTPPKPKSKAKARKEIKTEQQREARNRVIKDQYKRLGAARKKKNVDGALL
jgi:hypothetical protein